MQGLHGVRVRHLRQHLGREPLHRARNFTRVKRPSSQSYLTHLGRGQRVPHLGHEVQTVLGLLHQGTLRRCQNREQKQGEGRPAGRAKRNIHGAKVDLFSVVHAIPQTW